MKYLKEDRFLPKPQNFLPTKISSLNLVGKIAKKQSKGVRLCQPHLALSLFNFTYL